MSIARWLDPGHGTELLGASCALVREAAQMIVNKARVRRCIGARRW